MEIFGPRLKRLEDCHIRDDSDISMNAAEALEVMFIHRDCDSVFCARKVAAARMIGLDADKYAEPSNVRALPPRSART